MQVLGHSCRHVARLRDPVSCGCGPRRTGNQSPPWTPPGVSEMSHSSFEQDELDEAEVFGRAVAEDLAWVAMPDLAVDRPK